VAWRMQSYEPDAIMQIPAMEVYKSEFCRSGVLSITILQWSLP
jgi:hypothetical protein